MNLKVIITACLIAVIMNITSAVDQDAYTIDPQPTIQSEVAVTPNISTPEIEDEKTDNKKVKDIQTTLQQALETILGPETIVKPQGEYNINVVINTTKNNKTLVQFFKVMDQLSADVCKKTQEAIWNYATDATNPDKKNALLAASREQNELRRDYWAALKNNYYKQTQSDSDSKRKTHIIKERAICVLEDDSQLRDDVEKMQGIWTNTLVCAYNTSCGPSEVRDFGDIISIFKKSRNPDELLYYWKAFHETLGPRIRPVFQDYIQDANSAAKWQNFSNAGEMLRFPYEDENFKGTVKRLWDEMKPLYILLKDYVRENLRKLYGDEVKDTLPAHLLGNLWAQDWQSIYPIVSPHPERNLMSGIRISSRSLFDNAAQFLRSMGFRVRDESFSDVDDIQINSSPGCVPFSHDMCDGINYRIRWCGRITPAISALSQATKLLAEIQYYEHYSHLDVIFRRPPIPAFKTAIADLLALQLTSPEQLKRFHLLLPPLSPEVHINHLMWVALEKLPLVGYAYVLDSWRWDVFEGEKEWNQHWWNLRMEETGISPPVERDETDLDAAAKHHVVTHQEYIKYLVSTVLQFQILHNLCKVAHKGPLHRCSLYEANDAGERLQTIMGYGAIMSWRDILRNLTMENQLSTEGILEYFKPLQEFLHQENRRRTQQHTNPKEPSVAFNLSIGIIVGLLSIGTVIWYCLKKCNRRSNRNVSMELTQNNSRLNENTCIGEEKF